MSLNESIVEAVALEWFEHLGYAVGHGPHLAPGELVAERDSFGAVVRGRTPSPTRVNYTFRWMVQEDVPVESTTKIANSF